MMVPKMVGIERLLFTGHLGFKSTEGGGARGFLAVGEGGLLPNCPPPPK